MIASFNITIRLVIQLVITRANYPHILNPEANPELDMLIKQQEQIWNRSTTLQLDCIANQIAMTDMNFYKTSELRSIKNGKITYEYFCLSTVTRFVKKYYKLFETPEWNKRAQRMMGYSLVGAMLDLYDWYKTQHLEDIEAIHALIDIMFPNYTGDRLHRWILLQYNSRMNTINKLINTLKYSYSFLHITEKESERLISQVKRDNFKDLRDVFKEASVMLYSNKGCIWNGNRIGLGNVLFSLSVKKSSSYSRDLQGWKDGLIDFTFNDSMFYYITKYDITILTHGDDLVVTNNDWHILPVKSPYDGITYHSISKLLKSLCDKANVTRINVLSCNPNKVKIYPDLYKLKTTLINIHEGNVFIG
jgi:hypothetical protein